MRFISEGKQIMDRDAFIESYSDFSDEDPEYIHEYLASEKIDVDSLQARLLKLMEASIVAHYSTDREREKLTFEEAIHGKTKPEEPGDCGTPGNTEESGDASGPSSDEGPPFGGIPGCYR